MNATHTTPQIFITDYASYNEGRQFVAGDWYDLTEFSDVEELLTEIQNRYNDAGETSEIEDLELMITDFEGFPRELYAESFDAQLIENIIQFAALDDNEKEILSAFLDCFGGDFAQALNNYEDAYFGSYDSDEDFAYDMAENCGYEMPTGWPYNCIDWERAARDLMYDYSESNGHYFNSNW